MCGIFGSVNKKDFNNEIIKTCLDHRGPDFNNSVQLDNIYFFHSRLAIQDIASGNQPMVYKNYTIIFNGEIYNHKELRSRYSLKCTTNSDTETILHLYEKIGIKMLNEFDGMFALAIYDSIKKELFIARDRAGKKPLYYYLHKEIFIFASELNVLKNTIDLEIDNNAIVQYLRFGTLFRKNTPYCNVKELENGHYIIINASSFTLNYVNWWSINDFYKVTSKISYYEAKQKIDELLHLSIKRRIEASDLEVGVFLSGGIDSGLVTSIASEYNSKIKSFTVNFSNSSYNEAPLAKLVAEKYNTYHNEINITYKTLIDDLENILMNYGEPFFDSSCIPSYYVCKEAKKQLTVILNGDGADELFGGYRRYVPFCKYDFFSSPKIVRSIFKKLTNIFPHSDEKISLQNYIFRLFDFGSKQGLETYLSSTVDIFEGFENNLFYENNVFENVRKEIDSIIHGKLTGLKKIMNLDFNIILFNDLLVKIDIATMANSLEGRSPFLSKELLEFVPTLPDKFKINGTTTKYILRDLAKKYLPNELLTQPKRGFEIPLKNWVESDLKDIIYSNISSSEFLSNFVKINFINSLLDNKIKISKEKRAKILWALFVLAIWHKNVSKNTI
ncbi:MAG: asparagine synthase (glutamine-hydrolyzing) [Melioribacteraceae bacterium]